jgi:hypothetical protein
LVGRLAHRFDFAEPHFADCAMDFADMSEMLAWRENQLRRSTGLLLDDMGTDGEMSDLLWSEYHRRCLMADVVCAQRIDVHWNRFKPLPHQFWMLQIHWNHV